MTKFRMDCSKEVGLWKEKKVVGKEQFSYYDVLRITPRLTRIRSRSKTETIKNVLFTKPGLKEMGGTIKFETNVKMLNSNIWHKKHNKN